MDTNESPKITSRYLYWLTIIASNVYALDMITWSMLLYCEAVRALNMPVLCVCVLILVELIKSSCMSIVFDLVQLRCPKNSLTDQSNSWLHPYVLLVALCIKSLLCTPLYPFIYHPCIYSFVTNKKCVAHKTPPAYSLSTSIFIPFHQHVRDQHDEHYRSYAVFWKLFGLNNMFALVRSLFLIYCYDPNDATHSYIWCVCLLCSVCSVLSLLCMLANMISHNTCTFIFRWCCFAAFYFGYMAVIRCLSYVPHATTHTQQFVWVAILKFMLMKIVVFSAPFSIWLGVRQLYLVSRVHHPHRYGYTQLAHHAMQCLVSCLFYILVWEASSVLFYVLAFYPKHYQNLPYSSMVFQWVSPYITRSHVLFRVIAFNYYILSKLILLNDKSIDRQHDVYTPVRYLCKHSQKCRRYYRLVTFQGLRQCLSFTLIDLVLWHYNSSHHHSRMLHSQANFAFLHFGLQHSFVLPFVLHLLSMLLTIAIPIVCLFWIAYLHDSDVAVVEVDEVSITTITELHLNDDHETHVSAKTLLQKMYCLWSDWKLETFLAVAYSIFTAGAVVLTPYILRLKYVMAHFYDIANMKPNINLDLIDAHTWTQLIDEAEKYHTEIINTPGRDRLLESKFGKDIASIILSYLPNLHELLYVE